MPRLWNETIEAHHRDVRAAILLAWHQRHVAGHLEYLARAAVRRLVTVTLAGLRPPR